MVAETPQSKGLLAGQPEAKVRGDRRTADAFAWYARPEGVVMSGTAWLLTARC